MEVTIDPWGASDIKEYERLYDLFGIQPLEPLLSKIKNPSRFMRRSIDFGHRDLDKIISAVERGKPFAVMSGIKPTGTFHLGSKMTAEKMVYFQRLSKKAQVFYAIADVEAYCDNGLPLSDTAEIAVQNVADILALGLDPSRAVVYKQSEALPVLNLASIFSRGVTLNMMIAIYGERSFALYFSALIQAGDILLPQLKEFDGPKPVLVPVGADQDPHIRLSRDLANKYADSFGFIPPGAIYHKLFRSLGGEVKMSKREPLTMLTLDDKPKEAYRKVMEAFTGGRATVEEQRKLGGEADKCVVYDLYKIHFVEDDDKVKRVYRECLSGERMCGDCKHEIATIVEEDLNRHQQKREEMLDEAKSLLKKGRERLASVRF